jgi:hypothetical protein
MQRLRAGFALVVTFTLCFGATARGATTSVTPEPPAPCRVGGPPLATPTFLQPTGPILVVACGTSFVGPFEIAAYPKDRLLCTTFESAEFGLPGSVTCGKEPGDADAQIQVMGSGEAYGAAPSISNVWGEVEPDVASVDVRYHRGRQKAISTVHAAVAQVNGDLLAALHQTAPFGRFGAILPGRAGLFRVLAFNAEGQIVGSERGSNRFRAGSQSHRPTTHPAIAFRTATRTRSRRRCTWSCAGAGG